MKQMDRQLKKLKEAVSKYEAVKLDDLKKLYVVYINEKNYNPFAMDKMVDSALELTNVNTGEFCNIVTSDYNEEIKYGGKSSSYYGFRCKICLCKYGDNYTARRKTKSDGLITKCLRNSEPAKIIRVVLFEYIDHSDVDKITNAWFDLWLLVIAMLRDVISKFEKDMAEIEEIIGEI